MKDEEKEKKGKKLALFFIGFIWVVVVVGSLLIGAIMSCNNGGGELVTQGWACVNMEVIGVCEFGGEYYLPPPEAFNVSGV